MSEKDLAAIIYNTAELTYHPALFRITPNRENEYHSYALHMAGFELLSDAKEYVITEHDGFNFNEILIYWNGAYPHSFTIRFDK